MHKAQPGARVTGRQAGWRAPPGAVRRTGQWQCTPGLPLASLALLPSACHGRSGHTGPHSLQDEDSSRTETGCRGPLVESIVL